MNGNEAFKYYREKNGYSVRKLATASQVSPRMISYYENGQKPLTSMTVQKTCVIFELFKMEVAPFYDMYYPYKLEMDEKIKQWKVQNPKVLDYDILKHRMYQRLAKNKERGKIPAAHLDDIYALYQDTFERLESRMDDVRKISEEDYRAYILPLNGQIKKELQQEPDNIISKRIWSRIMQSEYSIPDVAALCGISGWHLKGCITETYDFTNMHIDTALKLCYVLSIDFDREFRPEVF